MKISREVAEDRGKRHINLYTDPATNYYVDPMNLRKKTLEIREALKKESNARYRKAAENYFKEGIRLHGVRVPVVRRMARAYYRELKKEIDCNRLFKLANELMKTKIFEEQIIAVDFVRHCKNVFDEKTFSVYENWLDKYVKNWAICDDLCTHIMSPIIEKKPFLVRKLLLWARAKNRWKRRAAAVSLVMPARRGLFINDVFLIASRLISDKDYMVQKGVGWLLKESSRKHQKEVLRFILKWKNKISPLVIRLAMEKFSKDEKKKIFENMKQRRN